MEPFLPSKTRPPPLHIQLSRISEGPSRCPLFSFVGEIDTILALSFRMYVCIYLPRSRTYSKVILEKSYH